MMHQQQPASHSEIRYIDVSRIDWYDRFFSTFAFDSAEECIAAIAGIEVDVPTLARSHDLAQDPLSGWVYWLFYLKGYLQYLDDGSVAKHNVYYIYLTRYFGPQGHDPGMTELFANPITAAERTARRFHDVDRFRSYVASQTTEETSLDVTIDPAVIVVCDAPTDDTMVVYEVGSDTPLPTRSIDGYHRFFLAKLFGISRLCATIIRHKQ